jgi:uncharacterized protein
MTNKLIAVKSRQRIQSLDILRGFALFGIALVNIFGFNASFFDFGGFYNHLPDPEQQKFYTNFIGLTADKFIAIYSFLFGFGFYLQFKKFNVIENGFAQFYGRKLFYLALFGICHIVFLWAGDILFLYAIAGFLLLIIRRLSTNKLLVIGFVFYFFISIWLLLSTWITLPNGLSSICTECLADAMRIYPSGNYFECLKLRLFEYYSFKNINLLYYLPKVFSIFIFGFLASKYKMHQQINSHKLKWFLIFILVTILGILLYLYYEKWIFKILPAKSQYIDAGYMGAYELMNLFLSSAYILFIMLLSSLKINLLKPFAYAGRMSLTNYIMQSILFSILFYGWGFGKFGMKEPGHFIWYAVGIFFLQLILSYFWLKYYQQGPLEWLWRKLSYRN